MTLYLYIFYACAYTRVYLYIMCKKKNEGKIQKKDGKYCEVLKVAVPLHSQTRKEPPQQGGQA